MRPLLRRQRLEYAAHDYEELIRSYEIESAMLRVLLRYGSTIAPLYQAIFLLDHLGRRHRDASVRWQLWRASQYLIERYIPADVVHEMDVEVKCNLQMRIAQQVKG